MSSAIAGNRRPDTDSATPSQGSRRIRPLLAAPGLRPRKASRADECTLLEQLPNIGPSLAADLRILGVQHPQELVGADAFHLYQSLCTISGRRQDPCVLDAFLAATAFMRGAPARPWWAYTAERKATYGSV
ncbi:MAG: hypothetical protein RJA10_1942 [Pseudomonadota bacterium]|jgi:hypothetical protein